MELQETSQLVCYWDQILSSTSALIKESTVRAGFCVKERKAKIKISHVAPQSDRVSGELSMGRSWHSLLPALLCPGRLWSLEIMLNPRGHVLRTRNWTEDYILQVSKSEQIFVYEASVNSWVVKHWHSGSCFWRKFGFVNFSIFSLK